jgi:hypothetical protein
MVVDLPVITQKFVRNSKSDHANSLHDPKRDQNPSYYSGPGIEWDFPISWTEFALEAQT